MKRIFTLCSRVLIFVLSFMQFPSLVTAQSYNLGWSGTELVPKTTFLNPANWTTNVPDAGLGDKSIVAANGDTLILNWTFGPGNRYKWAQCYLNLPLAISLANYDLFGFDLKGMPNNGYVGFELKFEDGTHQAVVRWDGLAGLNRWAHKISAAKKQFENSASMDWNNVRVISLAVYAQASDQYINTDQGSVSIFNLVGTKMADWKRATSKEFINPNDFEPIKQNAIDAIINRQTSTGLLTTWTQDNSSWLYGQGLALKALSCEGSWNQGVPSNSSAMTAEKLALFLAANQQPEGYWPRAWNSESGAITVLREADGTVWMGDFPWIITGLQAYYKKSGDQRVKPAIQKGLDFLMNLIMPDGKFLTVNPQTGITTEVASCEAYAAAILSLYESGETTLGDNLFNYINTHGWDPELRCWRESTYSDRIVLFANTWMSYYNFQRGETQKGLDALSLAGNVLYTHGNGEMVGMDGIVPLAVWIEGTLSYIADGGPGSILLFEEVQKQIKPDGMVPHYNENLGGMGGIWAVDWHSLDGTSWLYFTSAGKSPFDVLEGSPVGLNLFPAKENQKHFNVTLIHSGELLITPLGPFRENIEIRVFQTDGRMLMERKVPANSGEIKLSFSENYHAAKVILVQISSRNDSESYPVVLY
ncbi:MAG: hypothetical protein WC780_11270 [Lentimicrobiaceae bacterium]|jgi:hypothetical protein